MPIKTFLEQGTLATITLKNTKLDFSTITLTVMFDSNMAF